MSVINRPYAGTWNLNNKKLVQWTPDAVVYINGNTSVPGCVKCNSYIDIQDYVTEVTVDAGTDAGAASASFTMEVPTSGFHSFSRDGSYLIKKGMEVHIYERGYFPVRGMYQNLSSPYKNVAIGGSQGPVPQVETDPAAKQPIQHGWKKLSPAAFKKRYEPSFRAVAQETYPGDQTAQDQFVAHSLVWAYNETGGIPIPDNAIFGQKWGSPGTKASGTPKEKPTREYRQSDGPEDGKSVKPDPSGYYKKGDLYKTTQTFATWSTPYEAAKAHAAWLNKYGYARYSNLSRYKTLRNGMGIYKNGDGKWVTDAPISSSQPPPPPPPPTALFPDSNSMLSEFGLDGMDLENLLAYPYYHVFHGVVTNVGVSNQNGLDTLSVQCNSMLHFWQYQQMSSQASVLGARPANSKNYQSDVGHNFTDKHPYEIMYALHHDTAGAASGVAAAISQKTNVDAKSSTSGEDLYNISLKYWEQRFSLRNIRLRMHGLSGEMLNSLQAAFLSKLSVSSLTSLIRGRFNTSGKQPGGRDILSQSLIVGLGSKRKMDALLQLKNQNGSSNSQSLDINIAEMTAFVRDVSQYASYQIWESTYESKLDIAGRVCEVTGFEFYQDVDGDFVFKPPMYNLDTSSSRVYRIEDIDIISISFTEQEPQVTYMVAKGSHFHNQNVGINNEFGTRADYVDWRLVSQYGWRPGNLPDTSYVTDKLSLYYLAINKMDLMNVNCSTATVTIPLRPEIRPGYPVYIVYADAFYYCNSFSHSFSFGGQCTTSLSLVAKRGKFFAPGSSKKRGVSSIDLGNTILPERPVRVLDNMGQVRFSGFPNVVMALDPNQIDPLFLVAGRKDILSDPSNLEVVMKRAMAMGIVTSYPDPLVPGPYYFMRTGNDGVGIWFYLKTASSFDETVPPQNQKIIDLVQAAREFNGSKPHQTNKKSKNTKNHDTDFAKKKAQEDDKKEKEKLTTLKSNADVPPGSFSVSFLAIKTLLDKMMESYQRPSSFQSEYSGDPNASAFLLDLLSDKKATLGLRSFPGNYRYYSCSHPDQSQQGQRLLSVDLRSSVKQMSKRVTTANPYLSRQWSGVSCKTYSDIPSNGQFSGNDGVEAEFVDRVPKYGVRVLTGNPRFPHGEVVPTSEIRELMFASHDVYKESQRFTDGNKTTVIATEQDFVAAWVPELTREMGYPPPSSTIDEAFAPFVVYLNKVAKEAADKSKESLQPLQRSTVPAFGSTPFPSFVSYLGSTIPTGQPMNSYRFSDTNGGAPAWPGSDLVPVDSVWAILKLPYISSVYKAFQLVLSDWKKSCKDVGLSDENVLIVESAFLKIVAGKTGVGKLVQSQLKKSSVSSSKKGKNKAIKANSPVFPVSDANGYTVVGSYRYGRDIDIDPDGVFDVLHNQDIFSMLDKTTVDDILNTYVRGKAIKAKRTRYVDGKKVTVEDEISGTEAKNYLEKKVVSILKKNYSDTDLVASGKAKISTNKDGATYLDVDLANWIADGRDGISKIPINNAAYSLADIAPHDSKICTCKSMDAAYLLESGGLGSQVVSVDKLNQFLVDSSQHTVPGWSASQRAMRGK